MIGNGGPLLYGVRRALGLPAKDFLGLATEKWTISPAEVAVRPRSVGLPGQLDRVVGTEFVSDDFPHDLEAGPVTHAPTLGYLFRDVLLSEGSLYLRGRRHYLHRGATKPFPKIEGELERAALYVSVGGLQYFGQYLIDDCLTYLLCEDRTPLAGGQLPSPHQRDYETLLGMRPVRAPSLLIKELVVFEDLSQNASKRLRSQSVRERLKQAEPRSSHPGVFLLRGQSGARRVLVNEREVAESLAKTHGLTVIDPMQSGVDQILKACSGARVVVGVEGSHLVHGVMPMERNGAVLCLMPPQRFCTVLRDVVQRDGGHFGYVVGSPKGEAFSINLDEVEKTLALMLN